MSNRFVTVAAFATPAEARIAQSCLEGAGLRAFLGDEHTNVMAWHLGVAVGGVKLRVEEPDYQQALAILGECRESATQLTDTDCGDFSSSGVADIDLTPTNREQTADRALRSVVFGLFFPPLLLYGVWLLLRVAFSRERLRPGKRLVVALALLIEAALLLLVGLRFHHQFRFLWMS